MWVTAADVTDRDATKELFFRLALRHPEIAIVWADSAYAGKLVDWAKKYLDITIKTVRRPPDAKGFVVQPRRWVVERSWSWIMRARRRCRDHERLPEVSESLITWAAITLMTRRLTRRTAKNTRVVTPPRMKYESACSAASGRIVTTQGKTAVATAGNPISDADVTVVHGSDTGTQRSFYSVLSAYVLLLGGWGGGSEEAAGVAGVG
ncbi:transposase, partial [Streptomyces sp. NPDC002285]